MRPLDKHYLSLQFKNYIHSKNGTEYQSFFENIMEKAYLDFQKIQPYGNMGDGGNDGYKRESGIYYQVYAPNVPKIKEKEAAKKLQEDFQKLQNEWNEIANIKKYNFVFNDKYDGSIQLLEAAISKLNESNPSVQFAILLAKDLENIFFQLAESDMMGLGFNIDQREAIKNAYTYVEIISTELDRENAKYAQKNLEDVRNIISMLDDENLSLEYEILEGRCLQKLEKMDEAKKKYEDISKRFPDDPRPLLYLAEFFLSDKDFDKNKELLEKAEKIDSNYWLLKLEQMVRKDHLGEKIDTSNIDEKTFSDNPKIKASFYRLYGLFLQFSGDQTKADSFIEKAIYLNPNRFIHYTAKLSIIEKRFFKTDDHSQKLKIAQDLLNEIEIVEKKFLEYGDVGARNKAILNSIKLFPLLEQDNTKEFESISEETFKFILNCYFDNQIEQIIVTVLQQIMLPDNYFQQLLEYLKNSEKVISEELSQTLVIQFNIHDTLFTEGKKFFEKNQNKKYFAFICALENKNYEKVLSLLAHQVRFAVALANTLKSLPDLRKKIIESLPDDKEIQKDKLMLLLNYDQKDYDEAFLILKNFDLSNLNSLECRTILQIVQQKQAWDFEIIILEKLIEKERNKKEKFKLKSQLFHAYLNLKRFLEAINIGEDLLKENSSENLLDSKNKESLLAHTIICCFERGKVDNEAFIKAKEIFGKYQLAAPSFEFKAAIEAEIYLNNNDVKNALQAVIEGVKIKKIFSPQEYAKLYFLLAIKIGNQNDLNHDSLDEPQENKIDLSFDSLASVLENTFVKMRNKEQWYFIGDGNELDAVLVNKTNHYCPVVKIFKCCNCINNNMLYR